MSGERINIMKKKLCYFILIVSLLFSAYSLLARYRVEHSSRDVMLIMNSKDILRLENRVEDIEETLLEFKKRGLTGVAVHKKSIEDLVDRKEVLFITGREIDKLNLFTENRENKFSQFSYDDSSAFIYASDNDLKSFFAEYIPHWRKENIQLDFVELETGFILFFENWQDHFRDLSGFDKQEITRYKNLGLEIVPIFTDIMIDSRFFNEIIALSEARVSMFSGRKMSEIQSEEKPIITEIIKSMEEKSVSPGVIEPFLAPQALPVKLARELDFDMLRTHIILREELERYTPQQLSARYVRAVRERNVRLLYLLSFLETEAAGLDEISEINYTFLETLKSDLQSSGFSIGTPAPFQFFASSRMILFLILLGITAAIILLKDYFEPGFSFGFWLLIPAGFLLMGILIFLMNQQILLRQLLALSAAIIFPVLAVFQLLNGEKLRLLAMVAISLCGGILVAASLNHVSFSLQLFSFRGVKVALLFPLLIIAYYLFKTHYGDIREGLREILGLQVRAIHLLCISLFLFALVYYVMRAGNFPAISVPALEIYLREFFEEILIVRPRFKEIIIGYPAAILSIGVRKKTNNLSWFYFLIFITTLAPISVINSFSHIHTPLIISLARTFTGLILGAVIGLISLLVLYLLDRYFDFFEFLGGLNNG